MAALFELIRLMSTHLQTKSTTRCYLLYYRIAIGPGKEGGRPASRRHGKTEERPPVSRPDRWLQSFKEAFAAQSGINEKKCQGA